MIGLKKMTLDEYLNNLKFNYLIWNQVYRNCHTTFNKKLMLKISSISFKRVTKRLIRLKQINNSRVTALIKETRRNARVGLQ